ncbi:hypothetical protein [Vibrio antiquarius]|uniref:hypothetical protein n=1 Tax=Vibrio antiquarius (strain Ex25) TaxID=150340 RepID=UPI00265950B8|nr:hypothetical protein [Vibrio antiquarius]MCR9366870.1 hypothetical protein [Vibrio antiquarius]
MKAHKTGIIDKGFVLDEKGLRRIISTAKEQLSKANLGEIFQKYEVKYNNGVIEIFSNIEDVLELDNVGSSKLSSLFITLGIVDEEFTIELTFKDLNSEIKEDSIHYKVTGNDRDWLFITISQIEERVESISRSKLWAFNAKFNDLMMFFGVGLMLTFYYVFISMEYEGRVYYFEYDKKWEDFVEVDYNVSQEIKKLSVKEPELSPIEVLYEYQLILDENKKITEAAKQKHKDAATEWFSEKNSQRMKEEYKIVIMLMGGFIPAFLLYAYSKLSLSLYPLYVFCWGDAKDNFSKTESRRRTILIGVGLSFVVSVAAGLFVNLI